jgi:hypothetical protein
VADQLVATGWSQSGLDKSDRWRRVLAAITPAISAASCYFNKVSFQFKTGAISAEIGHSSSDHGC